MQIHIFYLCLLQTFIYVTIRKIGEFDLICLTMSLSRQCNKYLCFDHLKDHTDRFNEELTPINNEFNQLFEQLNKISLKDTSFIKKNLINCV